MYFLVGPPAESGDSPSLYVGECDPLRPRLEDHYKRKDFWTHAIAFTSKDENLNKAHVQYLESRLVSLAREAKRCTLENGNIPALPSLSEADTAEMDAFLDEMLVILPILGLYAFERPQAPLQSQQKLTIKSKGITATGYEADAGFVVLAGSEMAGETVPSIHNYLHALRQTLLKKGIVTQQNSSFRFAQDYTFDSPSTAAGVVVGRSANGRVEWKDAQGRTLKEIQLIRSGLAAN